MNKRVDYLADNEFNDRGRYTSFSNKNLANLGSNTIKVAVNNKANNKIPLSGCFMALVLFA